MRYSINRITRYISLISLIVLCVLISGCKSKELDTKIVLTTGFADNEIFKIEEISCYIPEFMVYLTTTQNRYEDVYGSKIWDVRLGDITLEDNIKELVLAKITRIKVMNLLAKKYGIFLEEDMLSKISVASNDYYSSLSEEEKSFLHIKLEDIEGMYREYALANKLYEYIVGEVNPEISDDEARTITVIHILFKTYTLDDSGNRVANSAIAINNARKRAEEVRGRILAGEDMESLAKEYSEDSKLTYSFGKGGMIPSFEEAAFNLGTGDISDIVETEYGYHIIKCISTFNREETDINKVRLVNERKEAVFFQEYSKFSSGLTRSFNDRLWDDIELIRDAECNNARFFEIYDEVVN